MKSIPTTLIRLQKTVTRLKSQVLRKLTSGGGRGWQKQSIYGHGGDVEGQEQLIILEVEACNGLNEIVGPPPMQAPEPQKQEKIDGEGWHCRMKHKWAFPKKQGGQLKYEEEAEKEESKAIDGYLSDRLI